MYPMKSIWNIPNILSAYRILIFPYILYCIYSGKEELFTLLISLSLITDVLDGLIARRFNLSTELGARLDSAADLGTYLLAFIAIFKFKAESIGLHIGLLYLFLGLFILCYTLPLLRYRRLPSFHLYSWKVGGYLQGFFIFSLFNWGFWVEYYYLALGWGVLSFVEHLSIQFMLSNPRSNLKGLWWVLKDPQASEL